MWVAGLDPMMVRSYGFTALSLVLCKMYACLDMGTDLSSGTYGPVDYENKARAVQESQEPKAGVVLAAVSPHAQHRERSEMNRVKYYTF